MVSRNAWSARLLGVRPTAPDAGEPGLILIQIDGLSRHQFERAVAGGRLPFLARMIGQSHFSTETFYSGVPSTTPAVQGEIFYGVKAAVPSFQFFRKRMDKEFRMYEPESAEIIEKELLDKCPEPLLKGGHAYSNIYRGGADMTRYCSADLAPKLILRRMSLVRSLVVVIMHSPRILRIIGLAALEVFIALLDAIKGLYARQDVMMELAFVPARIVVCLVGRELIRFRVLMDIERGERIIHANFLGYDEQSHRRGPGSEFAHWTLKGIDRAIRDIYRSAARSGYRDYEMMVYSDHGQEKSTPYAVRHGRDLNEALEEVFSSGSLSQYPVWMKKIPNIIGGARGRCMSALGFHQKAPVSELPPNADKQIIVTAMGPVGHIYFPISPTGEELENYARSLVSQAKIPLVLLPKDEGAIAFNSRGRWTLPKDRAEILGDGHPFLDETAEDLVRLCLHPDAGDMVVSGWDPKASPLTFPMENGAHGGPGSEETRGFLLVPDRIRHWHLTHLGQTRSRVRGEDLRKIVMHYLRRDGEREERAHRGSNSEPRATIRVMSYNIHSCIGMDGKVRPERVARVINRFDPDIVAVQEVDCNRMRSGGHDQSQVIADHLGMHHVFLSMLERQAERYGIAIFSKYPIDVIKAASLKPAVRGRFREARGAIWVKLSTPECDLHFINTHLGLAEEDRLRQIQELLGPDWLGSLPEDARVVVCGDLNAGPGSKTIAQLRSRLRDVQQELPDHMPQKTFTSVKPFRRIDHVFVSSHFRVEAVSVPRTATSTIASDHLPVCAELSFESANESD
ncbi:MAG: endonuclease/exonuclease/phosphatase family protein [Verrucomicrobiota bacterium]